MKQPLGNYDGYIVEVDYCYIEPDKFDTLEEAKAYAENLQGLDFVIYGVTKLVHAESTRIKWKEV